MVFKVDANGKKTILLLTLGNLLITAVFLALVIALPFIYTPASANPRLAPDIYLFMFAILLILYIILHELTHGAAYKILTHEKLTFGITLTCAFCGVPERFEKNFDHRALLSARSVFDNIRCAFDRNVFLRLLFVLRFRRTFRLPYRRLRRRYLRPCFIERQIQRRQNTRKRHRSRADVLSPGKA